MSGHVDVVEAPENDIVNLEKRKVNTIREFNREHPTDAINANI